MKPIIKPTSNTIVIPEFAMNGDELTLVFRIYPVPTFLDLTEETKTIYNNSYENCYKGLFKELYEKMLAEMTCLFSKHSDDLVVGDYLEYLPDNIKQIPLCEFINILSVDDSQYILEELVDIFITDDLNEFFGMFQQEFTHDFTNELFAHLTDGLNNKLMQSLIECLYPTNVVTFNKEK